MRLGYFAMPLHPLGRPWAETLTEDRDAVILADSLGFHDAFIGEHLTDRHENITNSLLFLATLIHQTEQIRLGTGTTNLSHQHPVLVAANSAMFDLKLGQQSHYRYHRHPMRMGSVLYKFHQAQ